MISITPIFQTYKQNQLQKADYKSRPVLKRNSDTFELTSQSFKGLNLHLPVKEIEELFEKTQATILAEPDIFKKFDLIDSCKDTFWELLRVNCKPKDEKVSQFANDRSHEARGVFQALIDYADKILIKKTKRKKITTRDAKQCDKLFNIVSVSKKTIKLIKRYEYFLEKGLENDKMPIATIFKMAMEYAEAQAQNNVNKIEIIGQEVLNKCTNGIVGRHSASGKRRRLQGYELYIVFSNLIQNAAKYSKHSTILVKFEEQTIEGRKYLSFSVQDRGIGIPQKELNKILEEGVRGSNVGKISGTGLGLSRTNKIIKAIGGTLKIDSSTDPKDHGTTVTCLFRLKDDE